MAFSRSQIDQFLKYIGVPEHLHHTTPSPSLLKTLHTHMISACPYENLSIHYNPSHTIILDPQHLFQKIVLDARGRGGYCMELAILFNHILRGLGFDAYTAGARTRHRRDGVPFGEYPGWIHIVNIVTFPAEGGEERYHVDASFGGDGPTIPLPLIEGQVHRNLGRQEVRLVRDWVPTQVHRVEGSKLWIYQYRNDPGVEWNSYYAFTECEFMAADWEVVNLWASTSVHSWHTDTPIMVKFLRREVGSGSSGSSESGERELEIYGKRMLAGNVVKENLGAKTKVIKVCETEKERVEALREYFALDLTREEIEAIKGRSCDLDKDVVVTNGV